MLLEIKDILAADEVVQLREIAAHAQFTDGRISNTGFSEKQNLQVDAADGGGLQAAKIVSEALKRSRQFVEFAFPKRLLPPMLTRYTPGMKYGAHADAALLASSSGPMRSDISCTVFISDPGSYVGGELVLHLGARSIPIRAPAGAAIVYPSTTLHEVAPVQSGERLVAITFVESFVPDEADRLVIYELGEISALEGANMHWANRMRLEVIRQNLTRRWSGR